ncbi:MAG: hypothetical protein Q8K46_02915 [Deltaproteobacteria bacterium]|nr:hypothetical protein [Deltaproteobacteria bacterium]
MAHGQKYVALRCFKMGAPIRRRGWGSEKPDATHLIKVCCQAALGMSKTVSIFVADAWRWGKKGGEAMVPFAKLKAG